MKNLDASSNSFANASKHFDNANVLNKELNSTLDNLEINLKNTMPQTLIYGSQEYKEKIWMKRN